MHFGLTAEQQNSQEDRNHIRVKQSSREAGDTTAGILIHTNAHTEAAAPDYIVVKVDTHKPSKPGCVAFRVTAFLVQK